MGELLKGGKIKADTNTVSGITLGAMIEANDITDRRLDDFAKDVAWLRQEMFGQTKLLIRKIV